MLELGWPWAFLLLPLPVLIWKLIPVAHKRQQAALRVPFLEDFQPLAGSLQQGRKNLLVILLLVIGWILLVLATARPQWVGEQIELPVSGRDLMLAVDLSGSMQAEDFRINGRAVDRLTATKYVAGEFIRKRQGDRLGLILFGRNAYLQTPLTFDLTTVNTLLLESVIGLAGTETAIGDAIGLAIKRLKDKQEGSRVLILLTDGANTAGEISPLKAAELAASHGLKIYTIGIGADEIIRDTFFGKQRINPSQDLDEKTLMAIAEQTGGLYFRARDTEELSFIYQHLNKLEPVEVDSKTFRPVKSLYVWPLAIALILALLIATQTLLSSRLKR
ncbi:MAG: VWA domain-containing protein [Gammaproteobacteria bacterium]|nr:VWA domain-containing protein [Gammaproteobacteria bacterium]MBL6998823.1 VWA domain-containing protein [Gammaproteobacteria bacterium]